MEQQINTYKEVIVTIRGQPWYEVFGNDKVTDYFPDNPAKTFHLYVDKGVELSVKTEYVNVLEELMDKFKNSTPGKIMGVIQKFSDVAAGLQATASSTSSTPTPEDIAKARASTSSMIRILPPNVRYQTKLQNLPAWKNTHPLDIGSFKFRFHLGMAGLWDGRREVYNPALAFMKVNQPFESSAGVLHGPLPNTAYVYGEIGRAVAKTLQTTAQSVAGGTSDWGVKTSEYAAYRFEGVANEAMGTMEKELFKAINNWDGVGLVQITIGQFSLPTMYVESTQASFSVDTDDNGFPIWAEVTWSGCKTLEMATVGQMPLKSLADKRTLPGALSEEAKKARADAVTSFEASAARNAQQQADNAPVIPKG